MLKDFHIWLWWTPVGAYYSARPYFHGDVSTDTPKISISPYMVIRLPYMVMVNYAVVVTSERSDVTHITLAYKSCNVFRWLQYSRFSEALGCFCLYFALLFALFLYSLWLRWVCVCELEGRSGRKKRRSHAVREFCDTADRADATTVDNVLVITSCIKYRMLCCSWLTWLESYLIT